MRIVWFLILVITLSSFVPKKKKQSKSKKQVFQFADSCNKKYKIANKYNRNFMSINFQSKTNMDSFFSETIHSSCFQNLNEKEILHIFGKPKQKAYNSLRINIPKQISNYDSLYIYSFSSSYNSTCYSQLIFKFKDGTMEQTYYFPPPPNREDERKLDPTELIPIQIGGDRNPKDYYLLDGKIINNKNPKNNKTKLKNKQQKK